MSGPRLFEIGDRVMATEGAFKTGAVKGKPPVYGTVVNQPHDPEQVGVRIDGRRGYSNWHIQFWTKAPHRGK